MDSHCGQRLRVTKVVVVAAVVCDESAKDFMHVHLRRKNNSLNLSILQHDSQFFVHLDL